MTDGLVLVLGGARSGKSDFAVDAARRAGGPVTFVATATAGDDDMARRIERHQLDRPADWDLIEEALDLVAAVEAVPADHQLILDCLTLWTANVMFADRSPSEIVEVAERVAANLGRRPGLSLVVSNEVGLGIHPPDELTRTYRDLLGRVNRVFADWADTTLFFAAGRAVALGDPFDLLDVPSR